MFYKVGSSNLFTFYIRVCGAGCGKRRQTSLPSGKHHCRGFVDAVKHVVRGWLTDAGKVIEREREGVMWVGFIPISNNHNFFLFFNSLPLHQVSKPLLTLFTKV
ncbi:hypothetical protein Hanom_Chr14g01291971 [Helianthus anomalus]